MKSGNQPTWSMKADRKLIELAKTETLEAITEQLQLSPKAILTKAARLGIIIKRDGEK